MNTKTFEARVKAATKSHTLRAILHTLATTGTARPCWTMGSGRWTKNSDHTDEAIAAAKAVGLTVTLTNDAPRGSATGNMLTLDAASRRKVAATRKAWMDKEAHILVQRKEQEAKREQAEAENREREARALAKWHSDGATGENLLLRWGLFAAQHNLSIRTAPAEVREEKNSMGKSWNDLKALRKPYMAHTLTH